MAVKLLTAEYAYIANATWLDNITSCSFHCRVRFDIIGTTTQFVFRLRNGTTGDQISLRKGSTGDNANRLRWSVTGGGTAKSLDSTLTPVAGTTYDITCTWATGLNPGMKIYVNGVQDASGQDTTTQAAHNSGGGTLMISARPATPATEYGQCTLEHFTLWPGVVLDANRAYALHHGARPHRIGVPLPGAYYPMYPDQVATLIDLSGHDRKIVDGNSGGSPATDIIGGAVNPPLRPIQPAWPDDMAWIQGATAGSGPPQPNDWTQWEPDVQEGQNEVVITGLTNGTLYEFYAVFLDDTGNISADSEIVEATPTIVSTSIIAPAPWRRSRYLTKYRSGN